MLEMHGTVTAELQSICLVDDPASDPAYPDVEPGAEDVDDYLPPPDPPEGFDLLTAAPGVVTVTTGAMRGKVNLTIRVLDNKPSALAPGIWDTVEEIGFRALSGYTMPASGEYYPFSAAGSGVFQSSVTAKGTGFYRVRAHERNRKLTLGIHREDHEPATEETYLLEIWATEDEDEDEGRRRLRGPYPTLLR
ncbi:hypothetical protein [Rhodococcus sp. 077-4]|uniref:hypothetical protein n=1 Tax=Rhodococcus sp. 077-4 TaxID=2789271 RepID=UPI0039F56338